MHRASILTYQHAHVFASLNEQCPRNQCTKKRVYCVSKKEQQTKDLLGHIEQTSSRTSPTHTVVLGKPHPATTMWLAKRLSVTTGFHSQAQNTLNLRKLYIHGGERSGIYTADLKRPLTVANKHPLQQEPLSTPHDTTQHKVGSPQRVERIEGTDRIPILRK